MEATISIKHAIEQIVKEKGIDRNVVIEAMEQAVLTAANKKYRNTRELEAHYNEEIGEVELFEFVTVVEEVQDSYKEIDLDEARESDPEVEVGVCVAGVTADPDQAQQLTSAHTHAWLYARGDG